MGCFTQVLIDHKHHAYCHRTPGSNTIAEDTKAIQASIHTCLQQQKPSDAPDSKHSNHPHLPSCNSRAMEDLGSMPQYIIMAQDATVWDEHNWSSQCCLMHFCSRRHNTAKTDRLTGTNAKVTTHTTQHQVDGHQRSIGSV